MSGSLRLVVVLGALATAACRPTVDGGERHMSGVALEAERALLREADQRYTAAMDAGDIEGIVRLYAPDATRYPPNGGAVSGPEAMRAFAEGVASVLGFSLSATPISLEVSASRDMGYTLNLLELSVTGENGEPAVQWLRDFHAWRKGADGAWRIVEDIWHVMEVPPSL